MAEPQRLLVQAFTLKPVAAVNDIRVHQPLAAMARLPGVRTHAFTAGGTMARPEPGEASVFIWQRQILDPARPDEHLALLRAGHLVLSEWDDDPRIWPKVVETNFFCLRTSLGVQTSTDPLAKFIAAHNPEVGLFPNQLDQVPPFRPGTDGRPVTLFFGALNREEDWAPVMPELNRVLAWAGDRVRVVVVHDRRFFDALDTPHKGFQPTCDHARYRALLRRCDIALLPLGDRVSNHMKSDLKFLECAAESVAVLASPVVYDSIIKPGVTGLIYRTPRQFNLRLRALIGDPGLRRGLARAAWMEVNAERRLETHVGARVDWYRGLLARKDALIRDMLARTPELRTRVAG
ncbi:MAG: glycosyltransferase [Pseudomonadota bacterium]|nr:glycosyltransferase [Pseudomonadota bacterium]